MSQLVEPDHRVLLSPSLQDLAQNLARSQSDGSQNTVFYYQPIDVPNPFAAIAQAAAMVHAQPGARFGVMPGAPFFGVTTACGFDTKSTAWRSLDWTRIDYLAIEGDSLLSDRCAGKSTVKDYANLLATIAGYVREKNPRIVITAQLSFRHTAPATMIAAAPQLSGLVDGFFFSYPMNPAMDRTYCTPQTLAAVLSALRPGGR
jgi:hypothetical protein